ncbi:MAG: hypothetical protein IPL86_07555 [Flavobacteriales bacterium]|nr:hypothetical protein [Flavobacteriales bacterium]
MANHALDVQVVKVSYDWWWNGAMDGPSNYINAPSSRLIDQQHLTTDANGKPTSTSAWTGRCGAASSCA